MTVTKDDFEKIWASSSPLTPYSFSDAQYKEGWNFVGSTPPSRQMWDAFMQNADEKLKYLYQHEDIPLGHEYFTFNPNVPQGSLPLFGGEYDRATYSDLWNWVQEQTGYLKTEAEWQTLSTANNGNVPFYSDGDGSTTFRVPSLKCWVKGANGTVSEVGSYLAAGLPNITGQIGPSNAARFNVISGSHIGAFDFVSNSGGTKYTGGYGPETANYDGFKFDASASNSIYGNANTVVPESIVGMWLVKAYGVIVDTGTIDEQQYIDDRFNASKQYTDDAIADIGTIVTATNNTSTSVAYATDTKICEVSLSAGVWVITGKAYFSGNDVTDGQTYGIMLNSEVIFTFNGDSSIYLHSGKSGLLIEQTTRIVNLASNSPYYLVAYASKLVTVDNCVMTAVRIK